MDRKRFPPREFIYRKIQEVYNCGYDGEPLGTSGCHECSLKLAEKLPTRNWKQRLPKSVVEYMIENDYRWQMMPKSLARQPAQKR